MTNDFNTKFGSLPKTHYLRVRQIMDNIAQDLALLKEYEDSRRYEDDPRRRHNWERQIEELKASISHSQTELFTLTQQISEEPTNMQIPPELTSETIRFLIQIGTFAANELRERWRLSRTNEKEVNTTLDLSHDATVMSTGSEFSNEIIARNGQVEVQRIIKLIEQQRKLIYEWQQEKLESEEEYNRQRMTRAARNRNIEELDEKIAKAVKQIEIWIKQLGVELIREKIA